MSEITSDDILGKDVVDPEGEIIGVVQQLRIDKQSKKITGIVVDQGFLKPDLFIGLDFIKNFGIDSIFISQVPIPKTKGMEVYDSKGKKIGFVHDVLQSSGKIGGLEVKRRSVSKAFTVPARHIKVIGYNVILKVAEAQIAGQQAETKER